MNDYKLPEWLALRWFPEPKDPNRVCGRCTNRAGFLIRHPRGDHAFYPLRGGVK
mgnify:CR=1 FL=1